MASHWLRGARHRRMRRTRQINMDSSTTVVIQASSIEIAVRRPSNQSVTRNSGMRAKAGPGGKYMYSRPSTMNPSIPRERRGTERWPSSRERACRS